MPHCFGHLIKEKGNIKKYKKVAVGTVITYLLGKSELEISGKGSVFNGQGHCCVTLHICGMAQFPIDRCQQYISFYQFTTWGDVLVHVVEGCVMGPTFRWYDPGVVWISDQGVSLCIK